MADFSQIITEIKNNQVKPIYFLMGDEPFFIDQLSNYIEENLLSEEDKGFNQMVLYGRDVTIDEIISNAKRYPMMAERQVVIVKEAQELSRTIDKLEYYAANPTPTTVLVFCYKYKTIDKRKALAKNIIKNGELFVSEKLYENKVADWIRRELSNKKYHIDPKASNMLVEFLGTDLGKINNELNKLMIILPVGSTITPEIIEKNIGISKDYNNFELKKAIGERNVYKANQIIIHFAHNTKSNPLNMTIGVLNGFFTQMLLYHGLSDKNSQVVAKVLKINPYFVPEYQTAARNYPMKKVSECIALLREADLKSKGVGANSLAEGDVLKELVYKMLH
ncbi:MAG: DNA polymerase III subunit delta [Flavobacteriaceae bacterium]|nr:DNA polymerase III subunit delta [Flavobacteriaceae bacterium]